MDRESRPAGRPFFLSPRPMIKSTRFTVHAIAYQACVQFYQDVVGLKVVSTQGADQITFALGGDELRLVLSTVPPPETLKPLQVLHMMVTDYDARTQKLEDWDIDYTVTTTDGVRTASFLDPAGMGCEYTDVSGS